MLCHRTSKAEIHCGGPSIVVCCVVPQDQQGGDSLWQASASSMMSTPLHTPYAADGTRDPLVVWQGQAGEVAA